MLNTLIAGEKVKYELLGKDVNEVIQESESLASPEVVAFEEALSQFVTETIPKYISEHKFMFLGESQDEIAEKIYAFSTYAVRGFLQELAELELILPQFTEQIVNEASTIFETEEEIEVVLQEELTALIEKAENYALAKATGAYQILNEISKKKLLGALAGTAGAAYGLNQIANIGADEILKNEDDRLNTTKILGNLTGGLIGTSDEEFKDNIPYIRKLVAGAGKIVRDFNDYKEGPSIFGIRL